ncbi:unnamed protein product [Prorocentrum cordatum]|uniref:Uncharacterized protein n=1 Tax=Prorocentrum cordatum TaxID=2364126 RepID=A0ABN9UV90_9DINO|nr:unnamed protein product [Polarella glacialis]
MVSSSSRKHKSRRANGARRRLQRGHLHHVCLRRTGLRLPVQERLVELRRRVPDLDAKISGRYHPRGAWLPCGRLGRAGGEDVRAWRSVVRCGHDFFDAWRPVRVRHQGRLLVAGLRQRQRDRNPFAVAARHGLPSQNGDRGLLLFGGTEGADSTVAVNSLYGFRTRGSLWENLSWTGSAPPGKSPVAAWYDGSTNTSGAMEWDRHEALMLFVNDEHLQMWFKPPTTTSSATSSSTTMTSTTTMSMATGTTSFATSTATRVSTSQTSTISEIVIETDSSSASSWTNTKTGTTTSSTRTSSTTVTGTATMSTSKSTSATQTVTKISTTTGTSTTVSSSDATGTSTESVTTASSTRTPSTTVTGTATVSTSKSTSATKTVTKTSTSTGTSITTSSIASSGTNAETGTTPSSIGTSSSAVASTATMSTAIKISYSATGTSASATSSTSFGVTSASTTQTSTTGVTMTNTQASSSTRSSTGETINSATVTSTVWSSTSAISTTSRSSATDTSRTSSFALSSASGSSSTTGSSSSGTSTSQVGAAASDTSSIQSSTPSLEAAQVSGSIEFWFSDPDAVRSGAEAEKLLVSVGVTISQVVGMPASYVSVWFAEGSRRLGAATRRLAGGILEVRYSIYVPSDIDAESLGIDDAEASLNSVSVSSFTSLLQKNIDSNFGEAVYSVSVLALDAVVVDDVHTVPAEPDERQGSASSVLIIIVIGVGCCLGSVFISVMLFSRRRRRWALRLERDRAQRQCHPSTGATSGEQGPREDGDKFEFFFDMDNADEHVAEYETRQELTSSPSAGAGQAPGELIFDMDSPDVYLGEHEEDLAPSLRMHVPRLHGAAGGADQPAPEGGDRLESIFDVNDTDVPLPEHRQDSRGPPGDGDRPPPAEGCISDFVFDMDDLEEKPLAYHQGTDFASEHI